MLSRLGQQAERCEGKSKKHHNFKIYLIGDGSMAYPSTNKNEMNNAKLLTRFKPLTLVALIAIYAAAWFNWNWLWGLLLLFWVIPSLVTGKVYLVELISRADNPVYYWLITGTWVLMSVYLLVASFL